jgi:eukaryotic-like serine/threonine-protein kinase
VDCRTDIFSFGALLYEMLTGVRAFKKDTAAETMTAILNDDLPELQRTEQTIPPALERTVRHCLEKAPEQRFQSARDLAFDLESFSTLTPSGAQAAAAKPHLRLRWWYILGGCALLLLGAIAGWRATVSLQPVIGSQFHQVTYRRGTLGNARFSSNGQNILYTAAMEGAEPEIYTVAVSAVGGHSLGIKNALLLAVSSKGELAVALNPKVVSALLFPGELARTYADNGAPKPEIENVQAADFTPDGSELAIVRYVVADQMCQLEYPVGKILHRDRAINDIRFSPNGKYLAFITHDNASDDRGNVVIMRKTGEKVATSPLFESAQGLSWSASGDEVWFTSPLESGDVHAFGLSGKIRNPLAVPGRLRLLDIAGNGQLLAAQGIARRGMVVSSKKGEVERDLSWLDFSYGRAVSNDGKLVLFEEEGSESLSYTVFVRNVDGSPAVPIGDGYGLALSADKNWALAEKLTEPVNEIWLLPVGPGDARRMSPPNLSPMIGANFLSDGKKIVFVASETGRPLRTWLQDIDGSKPRAISDEGVAGWLVSPDDKWVLTGKRIGYAKYRDAMLLPVSGGSQQKIVGLAADDDVLGWTSDGQLYVEKMGDAGNVMLHIEKLNPRTGARTVWRDLMTPSIGGVIPEPPLITADGETYLYNYRMRLYDLYTVSGVR